MMQQDDWSALIASDLMAELCRRARRRGGDRRAWSVRRHGWASLVQAARPLPPQRPPWRGKAPLRQEGEWA
jgi:hypothetical protein